jgi:hypothetical protein
VTDPTADRLKGPADTPIQEVEDRRTSHGETVPPTARRSAMAPAATAPSTSASDPSPAHKEFPQ